MVAESFFVRYEERMKIGIVGGHGHATITNYPEAEFAWSRDGFDEAADAKALARCGLVAFPDHRTMLEEFQPDVIYVGTAYGLNGRLTLEFLQQGFPVITEKPLATDELTLQQIRDITADGQRHAIAEFTMRWNGAFERARDLIEQGAIGEVVMVQAQKTYKFGQKRPDFYKSRQLFGGIIPWVAVHAIDYAAWCTGLRYERVSAMHGNRAMPQYLEMEDHAAMMFRMEGGVPCQITADFLRPDGAPSHGDDRLRVTGTKGVLEVLGENLNLSTAEAEEKATFKTTEEEGVARAVELVQAAMGKGENRISTPDCLHITASALAAREAADTGTEQKIAP